MRKLVLFIAAAVILTVPLTAQNSRKIGEVSLDGWKVMEISGDFTTMTVSGGSPVLRTTDGRFNAKADKMLVKLVKAPKGQKRAGRDAIDTAELTGNVTFTAKPEADKWITGSGAKLTYNGKEQEAKLDGGGKVIQVEVMDPTVFEQPTVLRGEVIRINLKPNPAPDEWRIKAESSSGNSHLTITPKPESEKK